MSKVSLSGLDMSFLDDPKNRLPEDQKSKPKSESTGNNSFFVLPDLDTVYNGGFVSPVDGTFISSRSQLAEHNKRNNCIQTGDVRGEAIREGVRKYMKYDPSLRNSPDFKWNEPKGNLTEV